MAFGRIEVIEVACPLCGSPAKQTLENSLPDVEDRVPGTYDISRCSECAMIYLSRRPDDASLSLCYVHDYHTRRDRRRNVLLRFLLEARFRIWMYEIKAYLPAQEGSVLELGCGDSQFLQFLESHLPDRYQWTGLDLSVGHIRLPDRSKIKLESGTIEAYSPGKQFDLIIMKEVLEHVGDPRLVLRNVAALLKNGGILIGQLPDWDSPWRRLFPRHWGGLQVPRHQMFFTEDTLRRMLRVAALEVVKIRSAFDPGDLGVSVCNWITDRMRLETRPRKAWFYLPITLLATPVVFLQTVLLRGNGELAFVARKRGRP